MPDMSCELRLWSIDASTFCTLGGASVAAATSASGVTGTKLTGTPFWLLDSSGSFGDAMSEAEWLRSTLVWLERCSSPILFEEKLEYIATPLLSWLEKISETPLSCDEFGRDLRRVICRRFWNHIYVELCQQANHMKHENIVAKDATKQLKDNFSWEGNTNLDFFLSQGNALNYFQSSGLVWL